MEGLHSENFKKGEENLGWGKPKGGDNFQNERGEPTFQIEFRDKKRSNMGTFRDNLA